jgi:branched-chain amino acid aminotransferase
MKKRQTCDRCLRSHKTVLANARRRTQTIEAAIKNSNLAAVELFPLKYTQVHRNVLHNSEIRSASDKLIAPGQVGFLNGWGVFSTLRVTEGVLFAFERHYARLRRDAELLHVPFRLSQDELHSSLLSVVEANQAFDSVLRVALVRNRGGLFEGPQLETDSDLVAFTADLHQWGSGTRLTYIPDARFGASRFAGTKTTSWAQNLTWYEQAHQLGFDEALLLNEYGQISECTSANIFVIQGRYVYTPPLSTSGCLPGITRTILLEEIRVSGVSVEERSLDRSQLEASDCVFITSTTRDLLPVTAIDDIPLRQEQGLFDLLRRAFLRYRTAYVANAPRCKHVINSCQ